MSDSCTKSFAMPMLPITPGQKEIGKKWTNIGVAPGYPIVAVYLDDPLDPFAKIYQQGIYATGTWFITGTEPAYSKTGLHIAYVDYEGGSYVHKHATGDVNLSYLIGQYVYFELTSKSGVWSIQWFVQNVSQNPN
jgi:hypothetical protein